MALPFMLVASWMTRPASWGAISPSAWIALGYVSLFSMLIGFIFWYKGLAAGGIAAVGQLQLLQQFFGLGRGVNALPGLPPRRRLETRSPGKRSATGETGLMLTVTLGVILCVIGSRKFGS